MTVSRAEATVVAVVGYLMRGCLVAGLEEILSAGGAIGKGRMAQEKGRKKDRLEEAIAYLRRQAARTAQDMVMRRGTMLLLVMILAFAHPILRRGGRARRFGMVGLRWEGDAGRQRRTAVAAVVVVVAVVAEAESMGCWVRYMDLEQATYGTAIGEAFEEEGTPETIGFQEEDTPEVGFQEEGTPEIGLQEVVTYTRLAGVGRWMRKMERKRKNYLQNLICCDRRPCWRANGPRDIAQIDLAENGRHLRKMGPRTRPCQVGTFRLGL